MNNYLETKRFRLTAISPVHIKAGEADKYYGQGFIRLPGDKKNIYVIDTPKLQTYIYEKGGLSLVNKFSEQIIKDNKFNLYDFLKDNGLEINKNNIKAISKGIVISYKSEQNINKFISNGLDQKFIPGSSIKGAIKTAVLYEMLKNEDDYLRGLIDEQLTKYDRLKKKIEKEINPEYKKSYQKQIYKLKEHFANQLINEYIQETVPYDSLTKRQAISSTPQNKDFFRAVKISDTTNFSVLERKVGVLTLKGGLPQWKLNAGKTMEISTEIMQEKTICEFEISIDHHTLNSFSAKQNIPFKNIDDLIKIAQNFAKTLWDFENNYISNLKTSNNFKLDNIKKFYSQNINPSLRVGWASGLLGTTVDLLLSEEQRQNLRNTIFTNRKKDPAPKSRRFIISNSQPSLPLGWVLISDIDSNEKVMNENLERQQLNKEEINISLADLKTLKDNDIITAKVVGQEDLYTMVIPYIIGYENKTVRFRYPAGFDKDTIIKLKISFPNKKDKNQFNLTYAQ